ncbi:MAG: glycosyltransferase family 39 protein [Planctomycetes bacterium]|nr:glycosyltransferase family 39 protein [Planctomycetota bacterium]
MDKSILLTFTLAALVTRLYGTWSFPLFDDEVTSYIRGIHFEVYRQFPGTDLLIILFQKVFGTSEFFLRLPMALFGACGIPVFYGVARKLYDRYTAVCGTLLLLFSSYHLDHSQLTRYYAAIFFFGTLTLYFYLRFFETAKKKMLFWAVLATGGGVFFHPTFIAVPISVLAFSAIVLVTPQFKNLKSPFRAARLILLVLGGCMLFAFIITLPILVNWIERSQSIEGGWGYDIFRLALQTVKYFSIPITLASAAALLGMFMRHPFRAVYFGTMLLMPIGSLLGASFFVDVRPDYVFYTYPILFLASARFVAYISESLKERLYSIAMLLIILATMLPGFVSNYTGKRSLDVRRAVEYMKDHYQEGDKILSFLEGFNFYLGPGYELEPYLGNWYHSGWDEKLKIYEDDPDRLWIIYMDSRDGVSPSLKKWLSTHARLVLEVSDKRFDYTFKSIRVYLKDRPLVE